MTYTRPKSNDLCDRCTYTDEACSLRTEAHENGIPVLGCAHFVEDLVNAVY